MFQTLDEGASFSLASSDRHGVDVEQNVGDTDTRGDFLGLELVGDRQHRACRRTAT